jgi:hypothetical protein
LLRNILDELAQVLREEVGGPLSTDGIDAEIEARLVMSPSEAVVLDVYPSAPSRDSEAAAFGDLSGFYVVTVRARVTVTDDANAQDILVDMIDDEHDLSVAAAVESDQTLNGYSTQVAVDPDSFSGLLEFGNTMVGCTWRVLVGAAVS